MNNQTSRKLWCKIVVFVSLYVISLLLLFWLTLFINESLLPSLPACMAFPLFFFLFPFCLSSLFLETQVLCSPLFIVQDVVLEDKYDVKEECFQA